MDMTMMLKDKVAVIYGAGGAIGSSVARAFASEGARVFVTGRDRGPVDAVAPTNAMFTAPKDQRTEAYVTGRFG